MSNKEGKVHFLYCRYLAIQDLKEKSRFLEENYTTALMFSLLHLNGKSIEWKINLEMFTTMLISRRNLKIRD